MVRVSFTVNSKRKSWYLSNNNVREEEYDW